MQIKNRFTGEILFESKHETVRECVEAAVAKGADLAGARLTEADLAEADLTGARLAEADLTGAYLARANLTRANLTGAYLTGAYLARANLVGANLAEVCIGINIQNLKIEFKTLIRWLLSHVDSMQILDPEFIEQVQALVDPPGEEKEAFDES